MTNRAAWIVSNDVILKQFHIAIAIIVMKLAVQQVTERDSRLNFL